MFMAMNHKNNNKYDKSLPFYPSEKAIIVLGEKSNNCFGWVLRQAEITFWHKKRVTFSRLENLHMCHYSGNSGKYTSMFLYVLEKK